MPSLFNPGSSYTLKGTLGESIGCSVIKHDFNYVLFIYYLCIEENRGWKDIQGRRTGKFPTRQM